MPFMFGVFFNFVKNIKCPSSLNYYVLPLYKKEVSGALGNCYPQT